MVYCFGTERSDFKKYADLFITVNGDQWVGIDNENKSIYVKGPKKIQAKNIFKSINPTIAGTSIEGQFFDLKKEAIAQKNKVVHLFTKTIVEIFKKPEKELYEQAYNEVYADVAKDFHVYEADYDRKRFFIQDEQPENLPKKQLLEYSPPSVIYAGITKDMKSITDRTG